jgi:hypothetical protein
MEEMLTRPILLLTLAMVLAIGIERLLEVMRAIMDFVESRPDKSKAYQKKWHDRADKLRIHIEKRLDNAKGGSPGAFNAVLTIVARQLSVNPDDKDGPLAISVDKVRSASIRLRYKTLAVALGIAFAFIFKIDMVELVRISTDQSQYGAQILKDIPATIHGLIISGIAMGFGAGPVHSLITAMEKARRSRKAGDQ